MRSPEITVIIPAVNLLSDLRDCLGALQRQKSVELEILVLDRLGPDVRDPLGSHLRNCRHGQRCDHSANASQGVRTRQR